MKKKTLFMIAMLLCLGILLSACAQNPNDGKRNEAATASNDGATSAANVETTAAANDETYISVTADGTGNVIIPVDQITASARFYNYDADGVTVQLVAIRDAQGAAHISFNTCQSCSPSPKAYYFQQGDVLQCANCGFTFEPVEVGVAHGGCNPWPIDGVAIGEDYITVPAAALDAMRDKFTTWQGPVK